jgi:hypothetical protein
MVYKDGLKWHIIIFEIFVMVMHDMINIIITIIDNMASISSKMHHNSL